MSMTPATHAVIVRTAEAPGIARHMNPLELVRLVRMHRGLIWQFAKREVLERHKGAYLGSLWNILSPVITLVIYGFVFGYVFHSRWRDTEEGTTGSSFLLPFFLGHLLYHFFAECVGRATSVVDARPNLVKKVVFPVEILPVVSVVSGLIYPLITIPLLFIAQLVIVGSIPWTTVYLAIVCVPLIMGVLGISWILASLGVYSRDIRNVVQVLLQVTIFMTPVFYSPERIPEKYRGIYSLNPIGIVIEQAREVTLWGHTPNWDKLAIVAAGAALLMQFGYAFFMRTRRGLADVI